MYEQLGLEIDPRTASVLFGLGLGALFGALAQLTRFCLRRAVAGDTAAERGAARGVWLAALAVALLGTQGAVLLGFVDFSAHRFMAADLPVAGIVIGGLLFGIGMVLTRGCVSRLTVLAGAGNLRALTVLLVFAVVAHATLKGIFAPVRTALGGLTLPVGEFASLAALPGGPAVWTAALAALALLGVVRSGASVPSLIGGGLIGALAVIGWVGTGFVLQDDFDPIAMESLSFTSPWSETLFWTIASSAIPAGFGTGLVGGVLAGAGLTALLRGQAAWTSFDSPAQTGRYLLGAGMMGFGGVLAGGCTVGAGLSGVPTLSVAALLALISIVAGGLLAATVLRPAGAKGPMAAVPAE